MNEELDSQLSAMFDDELPHSECELLVMRLSRDPALQARWGRYAAIGAVLRGGDVRLGSVVARNVSSALAAEAGLTESVAAAAQFKAAKVARWWRPVAGVAVAASVAAVSILWLQQNSLPAAAPLAARTSVVPSTAAESPATYVVPPPAAESQTMRMPATELANYVVAHSQFSTPVSRGSLLSALMANESAATSAAEQAAAAGANPDRHADNTP